MDWLVFGDDWGAHPSTTQHLMRAMPAGDRVAWVGSLGMRVPRFNRADLTRVVERLPLPRRSGTGGTPANTPAGWSVTRPRVLPWHEASFARRLNRGRLASVVEQAARAAGVTRPALLTANPVVALYLDDLRRDTGLDIRSVGYLRLDDYRILPGVDRSLVELAEPLMFDRTDHVFATATRLLPGAATRVSGKAQHLVAQGVDVEHFGRVTVTPPKTRVLGFFGLVAEWINLELIGAVADAAPEWTIEIIGPTRVSLDALAARPNIRLRGSVPYAELPSAIGDWSAAWLPFRVDELSAAVNPVKLREYLAAGLPTCSTALPEVTALQNSRRGSDIAIVADAAGVVTWLRGEVSADSAAARLRRRASMASEGWSERAARVRWAMEHTESEQFAEKVFRVQP